MKKSLFLYLFIVAVVFNVFTYMYYSQQMNFNKKQFKSTNTKFKDSLTALTTKLSDADYFSFENNQNAQDYFDNPNTGEYIAYEKLIPFVKEQLLTFNDNPNGNQYVGFDKMNDKKFIINKIKVLNHRWIIVDFNNTEMWGEAIIKYFINEDKSVSFETAETLVYAKQ
jgi:hypothetical protein